MVVQRVINLKFISMVVHGGVLSTKSTSNSTNGPNLVPSGYKIFIVIFANK